MRPVRRFEVTPAIPPALAALPEIASNLHWSWDPEATRLFARLWPGWRPGLAHPAEMVRTTPAERLAELAADPGIVNDVGAVSRRLQTALKGTTWFGSRDESPLRLVAYFSPEFGISEALPQYSGGLGVLAGDHLKASSDLGVPLVGIGLLYTEGYFRQRLDADGWQQESATDFTPQSLGLVDTGVEVTVDLAGDPVRCHVWRADVGRIQLYLLDTDVEGNSPKGVAVTDRLYGGDEHHRLRQEIVLGIGGVRALRALGLEPDVFHSNEGSRRLPRPRACPRAGAVRAAVPRGRRGDAWRRGVHDPHTGAARASTASRGRCSPTTSPTSPPSAGSRSTSCSSSDTAPTSPTTSSTWPSWVCASPPGPTASPVSTAPSAGGCSTGCGPTSPSTTSRSVRSPMACTVARGRRHESTRCSHVSSARTGPVQMQRDGHACATSTRSRHGPRSTTAATSWCGSPASGSARTSSIRRS